MKMRILPLVLAACGGTVIGGDGGTGGDATIGDTGADGKMCVYQETRTDADRACNVDTDCTLVVRSVNCCQEQHEGIRADAAMRFQKEQAAQIAGCLGCGCAAQPVDDLGMKGNITFIVRCEMARCTSHAQ